jgi:hydrogenase maturation protease
MMKKLGVIGVGNLYRHDDGIGILLLQKLQKQRKELPKSIELIDGGTGGMNLLHLLVGFPSILLIDAVDFKAQPGMTKIFSFDEITGQKKQMKWSTHEADLLTVLEMSHQLGELPSKLVVFGVQPKDVTHGNQLSKELSDVFDTLYKELTEQIQLLSR